MDETKNNIYELVDKELNTVNEKFPFFASSHEAYAVIFQEFDEASEELKELNYLLDRFWIETKQNTADIVKNNQLEGIHERAVRLAVEAIQVAATARKAILNSR